MSNITHFTRATPMLDKPNVYIDGASIEDIKHRMNKHLALYKLKYTEISKPWTVL